MTPAETAGAPVPLTFNEVLDDETIDVVIDSLLRTDPPPYVLTVAETGLAVPAPPGLPVAPDHLIAGVASALELCVPADLPAVIDAWTRARKRHGAQTTVHLRRDPERDITVHFVDARHRFGVLLAIFIGSDAAVTDGRSSQHLFRPRVCTLERDEVSVTRRIDPALTRILGWTAEELIGKRILEIVHPDDRAPAIANWMEMLARPGFDQRMLLRMRHRDGGYGWFEITNRNLLNDPAHACVATEMVDVSERMEAVEALRANELLLRRLTQALPLGVIQLDAERRIVYRNELAGDILGRPQAATIDELFADVAQRDRPELERALCAVLGGKDIADVELTIELPAGERRASVAVRALDAIDGAVTGAIACITDVTERVRLREELERRAKFDDLTRCHNRISVLEALDVVMRTDERAGSGIAVVFIDLDRFKEINDRHGHAAGDELLRLTGERLRANVRANDIVGRLGGDEFLIVCPDVATPDVALEIAQRIAASLEQRAHLGGASIVPGSSIGVAWTDRPIGSEALVATADEAMYEAKRGARGPILALR